MLPVPDDTRKPLQKKKKKSEAALKRRMSACNSGRRNFHWEMGRSKIENRVASPSKLYQSCRRHVVLTGTAKLAEIGGLTRSEQS